jgi:dTDP-4-amino-4,6-dideoxygalactose transaminase
MLYGLVLRHENRKRLVNFLEGLNIETRDLLPLVNQPIYRRMFGNLEEQYPIARWINESGFYIGCHYYMADEEVEFVGQAFQEFFSEEYASQSTVRSSAATTASGFRKVRPSA